MSGREASGYAASRGDLFLDRPWVVVPGSDEEATARLCRDILAGKDEESIRRTYPNVTLYRTNRLAIHTCIACRVAALHVLGNYGGDEDDYLAMKFVIAC